MNQRIEFGSDESLEIKSIDKSREIDLDRLHQQPIDYFYQMEITIKNLFGSEGVIRCKGDITSDGGELDFKPDDFGIEICGQKEVEDLAYWIMRLPQLIEFYREHHSE